MANARIPLQDRLISTPGVLTPIQADVKCSAPNEVVASLNNIFNTSLATSHHPLRKLLDSFISQGFDLGSIYSRLRSAWPKAGSKTNRHQKFTLEKILVERISLLERLCDCDERERIVRSPVLTNPKRVRPRRLWDLHANRVVPYPYSYTFGDKGFGYNAPDQVWAISHSWTNDMQRLNTSVNGGEWPVPIPEGVTLDAVRTELLNLNAEYVWLDVLCLRQISEDPALEEIWKKEWRVDLSTIGMVFDCYVHHVLRYMNGLGKPLESFGWDDDRHWLNRAWTLQETKVDSIIGGVPEGVIDMRQMSSNDTFELLGDRLAEVDHIEISWRNRAEAFTLVVDAMRQRYSANEIDKVFGVSMMFCPTHLPLYCYEESSQAAEDAWTTCVEYIMPNLLGALLFMVYLPGDGKVVWRPSWNQLMDINHELRYYSFESTMRTGPGGRAFFQGPIVEVNFKGGKIEVQTEGNRTGKYFDVQLAANQLLQDKRYILVGDKSREAWVVCDEITESCHPGQDLRKLEMLRKVSVLGVSSRDGKRLKHFQVERDCCLV